MAAAIVLLIFGLVLLLICNLGIGDHYDDDEGRLL